jgi:hypothetical protein
MDLSITLEAEESPPTSVIELLDALEPAVFPPTNVMDLSITLEAEESPPTSVIELTDELEPGVFPLTNVIELSIILGAAGATAEVATVPPIGVIELMIRSVS